MRPVYLDNNATTRTDPEVVAAMLPFFTDDFGNPSSSHDSGATAASAVCAARQKVQSLLGAEREQDIIFTSGGTESNNAALLPAFELDDGRDELIVSAVEHPAILAVCDNLKKKRGIKVHRIPVDAKGRLDIAAYRRALGRNTALVSIMWANNETGTLFPVAELAEMAREAGALFHTDAVQAVGKIVIDLNATKIDMLSLSGHKFHGPKGIGVLYVRKGVKFSPLIRGGRQERARRGGTENVPAIVGLGRAAELARLRLGEDTAKVKALRDRFEASVLERIEDCTVNGDAESRLPGTSNIAFDDAESEAILLHLNKAGIAASAGSACTSGAMEPSHVLRAMNIPYTAAYGAIRFSFSRDNTQGDVDRVLSVFPGIVAKARVVSSFTGRRNSDSSDGYFDWGSEGAALIASRG